MKNILRFFKKLSKNYSETIPSKAMLCAVYSISQARIIEEMARLAPAGERLIFLSFCDDKNVNNALHKITRDLKLKLIVLSEYSDKQNRETVDNESQLINHKYTSIPENDINPSYVEILLRQKAACRQILTEENISTTIVCEDGPGGCAPLISVSHNLGLPVITVPFGIGEMRDYEMYLNNRAAEGTLNFVPDNNLGNYLRNHAPHWILNSHHGQLTLFPADFILARLITGLDIPKPWVVHGGNANKLCVESIGMKRIYLREGVDPDKLAMTGSAYADVIYRSVNSSQKTKNAYKNCCMINKKEPRILVALPPSYHQEKEGEFDTYEETISRLLKGIKQAVPNALITVSLHPAANDETIEVVKQYANISSEWLLEMIPKHDVFIPTFSSTIRWAITARKPVVNYDIYRFDLPTYDTVPAVFTTPNLQDALERLINILSSPEQFTHYSEEMKLYSDDWGDLDGFNFQRVWEAIKDEQPSSAPKQSIHQKLN